MNRTPGRRPETTEPSDEPSGRVRAFSRQNPLPGPRPRERPLVGGEGARSAVDSPVCRRKRTGQWQHRRPAARQTDGRQAAEQQRAAHYVHARTAAATDVGQGAIQFLVVRRTAVHVPPSENTVLPVHQVGPGQQRRI